MSHEPDHKRPSHPADRISCRMFDQASNVKGGTSSAVGCLLRTCVSVPSPGGSDPVAEVVRLLVVNVWAFRRLAGARGLGPPCYGGSVGGLATLVRLSAATRVWLLRGRPRRGFLVPVRRRLALFLVVRSHRRPLSVGTRLSRQLCCDRHGRTWGAGRGADTPPGGLYGFQGTSVTAGVAVAGGCPFLRT